ncbi:pilus assembly protein TadG-related protein [Lichenihabitans sp. Uapishka_5]|uniref:pilus assembly protein TadG-related protein n=1 Tax=Lichenihabitans sp. Uapishka_5 TaxID=3037302 RepID=UPI0029E8151A|nr:pilus assembly protein TadG-related protein [Lichenihabitans sp. Uapishka_5]MDX7950701.1 pilus assembly protein TadG-related protein [Lichenihabitans sp. Uapishka_5]
MAFSAPFPPRALLNRLRGHLGAFGPDRNAAAAILMALLSMVLIGTTAISLDGGTVFLAKRKQQAATDMAAMAAAATPGRAAASATALLTANGYATASLQVETGRFVADSSLAAAARFQPDVSAAATAVRITTSTVQPLIFGSALRALAGTGDRSDGFTIRTAAIARKQDLAAFTLGSGVADLDAGLLNALLGSLLGTHVSLSLLDYQSLAAAKLDLFDFSDGLATRIGVTGASYGTLATQVVTRSAGLAALADTLSGNAGAAAVIRNVAAATPAGGGVLDRIIDFGAASSVTVGASHPVTARVSALDLLTALARLGGDGQLMSLDLGASLPGLGSTQLMFALGQPTQSTGLVAVGSEGAILRTAQIRLALTTQLAAPGLPGNLLNVSVVLDGAPAVASLDAISCAQGAAQASVTLGVTPGLASVRIGSIAAADVSRLAVTPTLDPALVLNVPGLVSVGASGQAAMAAISPIPVAFTAADILAGTRKTVATPVSLADTLAGAMRNTSLTVSLLGAKLPIPGLNTAVQAALVAAATPIDLALERILALMGVSVGTATTSVTGVRCGQGLLVQ